LRKDDEKEGFRLRQPDSERCLSLTEIDRIDATTEYLCHVGPTSDPERDRSRLKSGEVDGELQRESVVDPKEQYEERDRTRDIDDTDRNLADVAVLAQSTGREYETDPWRSSGNDCQTTFQL
jgi:hypothetical protein